MSQWWVHRETKGTKAHWHPWLAINLLWHKSCVFTIFNKILPRAFKSGESRYQTFHRLSNVHLYDGGGLCHVPVFFFPPEQACLWVHTAVKVHSVGSPDTLFLSVICCILRGGGYLDLQHSNTSFSVPAVYSYPCWMRGWLGMHGTYCKAAKALLILLTGQASCLDGCRNEGRHQGREMRWRWGVRGWGFLYVLAANFFI